LTAASQQIVSAFETLGLSPEVIADQFDFDPTVVKATLMQFSAVYRQAAKGDSELDFNETEAKEARDVIMQIARYAEDDNLRLKAARYIRDDKKGRLDFGQQMKGLNINVLQFNAQMQKAIEATHRAKQLSTVIVNEDIRDSQKNNYTTSMPKILETITVDS